MIEQEKSQSLTQNIEVLNDKIEELRDVQNNIEQKIITVIRKLDRLQEYTEIDEMRNIVANDQLTAIVNKLYK